MLLKKIYSFIQNKLDSIKFFSKKNIKHFLKNQSNLFIINLIKILILNLFTYYQKFIYLFCKKNFI
jgi:hypothetical protein